MARKRDEKSKPSKKKSVIPKKTESISNTVTGAIVGGLVAGPVGVVAGATVGALVEPGLKRGRSRSGARPEPGDINKGGQQSERQPAFQAVRGAREREQPIRLKLILVPIDFSPTGIQALDYAVPLARSFGARLQLLFVLEPVHFMAGLESVALSVPDERVAETSLAELKALAQREVPPGVEVEVMVRQGKAFDQITQAAEEQKADLILLTTHGFTGLKRAVMGSTAEAVVRHAACSVWVVPARDRKSSRNRLGLRPTECRQP